MSVQDTYTSAKNLNHKDIPGLSDNSLDYWKSRLRAEIENIQGQIENWNSGAEIAGMDSDEWRDRAGLAMGVKRKLLGLIKKEQTERYYRNISERRQDMASAFVAAARQVLDQSLVDDIWKKAVENNPQLFSTPKAEKK